MNMHTFGILTLTFSLLALSNVQAEERAGEAEERASGQSSGGIAGIMVGAIGGPIGALIGAGVGALVGNSGEEAPDSRNQAESRDSRVHVSSAGQASVLANAGGVRTLH